MALWRPFEKENQPCHYNRIILEYEETLDVFYESGTLGSNISRVLLELPLWGDLHPSLLSHTSCPTHQSSFVHTDNLWMKLTKHLYQIFLVAHHLPNILVGNGRFVQPAANELHIVFPKEFFQSSAGY